MIKRIEVFDCDGVLVCSQHRYRNKPDGTIDLDYWIENRTPDKIARDTLLPHAKRYMASNADPEVYTVICTSRVWNVHDIEYIVGYLGAPDKLIMRPVDNFEGDAILKVRELKRLFNLKQFQLLPRFLWEDNKKNINALRDMFTLCYYVDSNQGVK